MCVSVCEREIEAKLTSILLCVEIKGYGVCSVQRNLSARKIYRIFCKYHINTSLVKIPGVGHKRERENREINIRILNKRKKEIKIMTENQSPKENFGKENEQYIIKMCQK